AERARRRTRCGNRPRRSASHRQDRLGLQGSDRRNTPSNDKLPVSDSPVKGSDRSARSFFRRVLVLTQYYAPESGAAAIRLRAMVGELRRLGFEVRVLTGMPNYPTGCVYPGFQGKLRMSDCVDGVRVTRVYLYPAAGRHPVKRLVNYLSFTVSSAVALAFEPRADLVFVEAQPLTLALPALANRILRGTPYIHNAPDLQVEYANEERWIGVRCLLQMANALEGALMRRAFSVTTVTRAFIDHFHREYGVPRDRFSFLPNGADTRCLRPLDYDTELAARLGVRNRKVFTYAGTHAAYQGLDVVLDAAKLLQHRSDLVFLMVGDGPVRPQLIARAKREGLENVVFHPTIPLEAMPGLMSITRAALVVLRRLRVSRKMRLAKAIPPLACGVPLIYAGWGETAEIVEKERVGLLGEPEHPTGLAGGIERLADNAELRETMGLRGRALAEREFSWSVLVEDWLRQIECIAAKR